MLLIVKILIAERTSRIVRNHILNIMANFILAIIIVLHKFSCSQNQSLQCVHIMI